MSGSNQLPTGWDEATGFVVDVDLIVQAPLPTALDVITLSDLVEATLRAESALGSWRITVLLTDDLRLQALHRDFLGLDSQTDVMTFPSVPDPDLPSHPSEPNQGGDIAVSVEMATAQAGEFGLSPAAEIKFLVVHGVLHLLGWSDQDAGDRASMLARQSAIIATFDSASSNGTAS